MAFSGDGAAQEQNHAGGKTNDHKKILMALKD
jgi:hypothetical protein